MEQEHIYTVTTRMHMMVSRLDLHICLFFSISRGGMYTCIVEKYDICVCVCKVISRFK